MEIQITVIAESVRLLELEDFKLLKKNGLVPGDLRDLALVAGLSNVAPISIFFERDGMWDH
jgi:hypothetical protein